MESNGIIRIESLRLKNFKNIDYCEISYPEAKELDRGILNEDNFSSVLGLYGQNGSSKSSCVEGLRVLQFLLSGSIINQSFSNYIKIDEKEMGIGADFYVRVNNGNYYVNYDCAIGKQDNQIFILNEKMSFHLLDEGNKKVNFYYFESPNNINGYFKDYLGNKNADVYSMVASLDTKTNFIISSIFNPKLVSFVKTIKGDENIFSLITEELQYFAKYRLAIYQINYFNELSDVGIRIRLKEESLITTTCDVFVPFNQTFIKSEYYDLFKKTIDSINNVLPSIIKDCRVELIDVVQTKQQDIDIVNDVVNFKLVSNRKGVLIPLSYESNGIKKIISILSGLMDVFNNEGTFVAIDELDSGIFEYLLGELIYAFDNFALGQLFFTSHNMRILEKVEARNIYFSTIDSHDKFIQIPQVRETNNLRNLYYRYIANGYKDKYKLYNDVKTEDIISSFNINKGK